jgi:hypothetical protein
MPVVYTAVQRFDPACGERWQRFIEWSGLKQLREVVSLDLILCPTVLGELTAEDWRHNVQEDFKITLFHDLDHVLRRVAAGSRSRLRDRGRSGGVRRGGEGRGGPGRPAEAEAVGPDGRVRP